LQGVLQHIKQNKQQQQQQQHTSGSLTDSKLKHYFIYTFELNVS